MPAGRHPGLRRTLRIRSPISAASAPQVVPLVDDLDDVGAECGDLAEPDEHVVPPVTGRTDAEQQPAAAAAGCRS